MARRFGELLRAEVVNLAGDLAVDVAGVEHQHLVAALRRLAPVEKPRLAGHGAGVEEVGADSDHHVHIAGFDDLPAHLRLAVPGAGRLGRHDEPGPALLVQIAVKVGDPEIVAVGDLLLLVDPRQAEGQAKVGLDLPRHRLSSTLNGGLALQSRPCPSVGGGRHNTCSPLDVALQAVHRQVHLGPALSQTRPSDRES